MRHEIASTVGATAGVTAEVAQDPTVCLPDDDSQAALNEEMPCCTMCGMPILCVDCGEEAASGYVLEVMDEESQAEPRREQYMDDDEDYDEDMEEEDDAS